MIKVNKLNWSEGIEKLDIKNDKFISIDEYDILTDHMNDVFGSLICDIFIEELALEFDRVCLPKILNIAYCADIDLYNSYKSDIAISCELIQSIINKDKDVVYKMRDIAKNKFGMEFSISDNEICSMYCLLFYILGYVTINGNKFTVTIDSDYIEKYINGR